MALVKKFFVTNVFVSNLFGRKSITWKYTDAIIFTSLTSRLFSQPVFLTSVFSILRKSSEKLSKFSSLTNSVIQSSDMSSISLSLEWLVCSKETIWSTFLKDSCYFSIFEIGIDYFSSSWSKIFLINACFFWTTKSMWVVISLHETAVADENCIWHFVSSRFIGFFLLKFCFVK